MQQRVLGEVEDALQLLRTLALLLAAWAYAQHGAALLAELL